MTSDELEAIARAIVATNRPPLDAAAVTLDILLFTHFDYAAIGDRS